MRSHDVDGGTGMIRALNVSPIDDIARAAVAQVRAAFRGVQGDFH